MLEEKISTLSNHLRNEGINVSIRSTQLACQVLDILREHKEVQNLKNALKSVYIKDHYDEEKFDKVYEELFEDKENPFNTKQKRKTHKTSNQIKAKEEYSDNTRRETPEFSMQNLLNQQLSEAMQKQQNLKEKDIENEKLTQLNEFDKRTLNVCRRLGMKIANKRIKKQKKSQKNHINIQKTIRKNLKYGGHLIDLQKTNPIKNKTQHIFLNDISGSCDWVSTWFFSILYGCQHTFNKLTIYEFDNQIINITDDLKTESYYKSYENVMNKRSQHGMLHDESNMTESFKQFIKEAPLNYKTCVIILSDCRDWKGKSENKIPESAKLIQKIVDKSKKVIILNPEPKEKWKTKTSCVKEYQDAGTQIYSIENLKKLSELVEKL